MDCEGPTPAARRQRRLRQRRKLGLLVAMVEVPLALAEALIEAGLLPEDHSADPERLGAALVEASSEWVGK